ncbi:class I SAM-dependent methyltransferase [Hoeflea sp. YIM 152468]|uniref:class I SAM-dependent methyltransferase n=1 Tax=Hoeflea sp. YIM 152468 TaxID=3031759 RepID=UPI0023DC6568|nr:class I SAM-dependent methyltransferase [Hoeflea sp. YIM 152468]MDF1610266.1 class I SAM-dependent methyltransferase [Hoeflea sp. YIM 152468]
MKYRMQPIGKINDIPIFSTPDRYIDNYDKIAKDHLESLAESGHNPFIQDTVWSDLEKSTTELMAKYLKPGETIFDAGVGLGRLLAGFPNHPRYGADISMAYLEVARKEGIDVIISKLEELPYENDSFDMVVCTDVLEHVFDLHGSLVQLVRVVRPGGTIIIRVPFEEDLQPYHEYKEYDFVHLRRFDLYGTRLLLEKIYQMEYLEHSLHNPIYRGQSTSYLNFMEDAKSLGKLLDKLPADVEGLPALIDATKLNRNEFETLMNRIATDHPIIFSKIVDLVAKPLEMNIVFRKPVAGSNLNEARGPL